MLDTYRPVEAPEGVESGLRRAVLRLLGRR
jgi:hypothetical protein